MEFVCVAFLLDECNSIIGPIAVTWANAMPGEATSKMAEAVMTSPVLKILLPLSQEKVEIVSVVKDPLPHMVQIVKEVLDNV